MMVKVPRRPERGKLEALAPDTLPVAAGAELFRVYFRGGDHPTHWSGFRHVGPLDGRFDHHAGSKPGYEKRSVMYLAHNPVTCLGEVFQKTRVINRWHKDPWLVGFELAVDLEFLDLTGAFPTRAGASMGLMTGPRSAARNWARAFYDVYTDLGGIVYPSSMHGNSPAIVLTDRAELAGALPARPSFHRALGDPALLSVLKNAACTLGYVLS